MSPGSQESGMSLLCKVMKIDRAGYFYALKNT